jgi:hypothetical protein
MLSESLFDSKNKSAFNRFRYTCVHRGAVYNLQRRCLALTRSSRFDCALSNMLSGFWWLCFYYRIVFLLALVQVRVWFGQSVSGQAPFRFPRVICRVVVPEPFDVIFHPIRFTFLISVCHYLLVHILD